MYHYRKTFKKYRARKTLSSGVCPFCAVSTKERIIRETKYSYIVANLTSYDLWENLDVTEHLLLIPKKHVRSLTELSSVESLDIMKLISEYQSNNYNVYARAVDGIMGSVEHQHTHLIRTKNIRRAKLVLFIRKPYWLFKR